MTNVKLVNGRYNRFEVLDKIDVVRKLGWAIRNLDLSRFEIERLNDEMDQTAKSGARLYLYDNKNLVVCSLSIKVYNALYRLLDHGLPLKIQVSHKYVD